MEHLQIFHINLIVIAFPLFAISGYERFHRNVLLSESEGNLWLFLLFLDFIGLLALFVTLLKLACQLHEGWSWWPSLGAAVLTQSLHTETESLLLLGW